MRHGGLPQTNIAGWRPRTLSNTGFVVAYLALVGAAYAKDKPRAAHTTLPPAADQPLPATPPQPQTQSEKASSDWSVNCDNSGQGLQRKAVQIIALAKARQRLAVSVSKIARLMVDAGLVAIVSLISPFKADRLAARARFEAGSFIEVHSDTPICERRDPKGQ